MSNIEHASDCALHNGPAYKPGPCDCDEMSAEIPKGTPLRDSWEEYKASDAYANSRRWLAVDEYRDGSMWASYCEGFMRAVEMAASLHESVNPASDEERLARAPGAGAMGAVIEYRDLIRASAQAKKG